MAMTYQKFLNDNILISDSFISSLPFALFVIANISIFVICSYLLIVTN